MENDKELEEKYNSDWIKTSYETMGWNKELLLIGEEIKKNGSCIIGGAKTMVEPKPDESRLLTQREIIGLVKATPTDSELALALIARRNQDAKTTSILQAEFVDEKAEFGLSVNEAAYKQGRAECQQEKEEFVRKIEDWLNTLTLSDCFQSLKAEFLKEKKQEGVINDRTGIDKKDN